MTQVKQRDGEAFDSMLRRFNRRVQQNGILSETRKRQAFEPPSALKKKKMANKKRKSKETLLFFIESLISFFYNLSYINLLIKCQFTNTSAKLIHVIQIHTN